MTYYTFFASFWLAGLDRQLTSIAAPMALDA
jgi:hypothetical protein